MFVWSIEASDSLDLEFESLPDTIQDGFNNNINVFVKSISDKSNEESLVSPSLLISLASKYGLELIPSNELKELSDNNQWNVKEFFKSNYIASKDVNAWLGLAEIIK